MIRKTYIIAVIISGLVAVSATQAETFVYELQDLSSYQGSVVYPGLDLNGATSAKLVIDQDSPQDIPKIVSLVVDFSAAEKLTARNFKGQSGQFYSTKVNNAWVYRQLDIKLHGFDINNPNGQFINIEALVSESKGYINNNEENPGGQLLFNAHGRLVNITPTKVVDKEVLTVNGSRLRLYLRNGLVINPNSVSESVFVINSLWFGNGEQDLYLPSGFLNNASGFVKPFRINVETIPGFSEDEKFISVTSKDELGNDIQSPLMPLQDALNQAYSLPQ
jgi:hypothetical protein